MLWRRAGQVAVAVLGFGLAAVAQMHPDTDGPLPPIEPLIRDVEAHQKQLEAATRDYVYRVHRREEELRADGSVKKVSQTDAESLVIDGIRVNRIIARDGKPLSDDDKRKEEDHVNRDVEKGKELRAKGQEADRNSLVLSRILELGKWSHERRVVEDGRREIVLDFTGDPNAKTNGPVEEIFKSVVGQIWIDEADRVLVRGEGELEKDYKIGGGLVADVRKGAKFSFGARRMPDGTWLPAHFDGQGDIRVLLIANFHGRMHVETSDYRRFRTSSRVVSVGEPR
jgi:hypothetical protein